MCTQSPLCAHKGGGGPSLAVVHTTAGGVHRTLGGGALPIPKQPLFRALARRCLTTPQKGVVTFTHAAGAANVTTSSPHNLSRPSGDLREPNNLGRPQESPLGRQTAKMGPFWGEFGGPRDAARRFSLGPPGRKAPPFSRLRPPPRPPGAPTDPARRARGETRAAVLPEIPGGLRRREWRAVFAA